MIDATTSVEWWSSRRLSTRSRRNCNIATTFFRDDRPSGLDANTSGNATVVLLLLVSMESLSAQK